VARKGAGSVRAPKAAPAKRPSGWKVAAAFGVAIAAAVALIVAAVATRGGDDGSPDPSTPTAALDLTGIPQEGVFLGSPDANVTLIEYADLQCPACRAYNEAVVPSIVDRYVRPGDVRMEFRGLAFIGDDSERALRLVFAAGLQNRLWNLEDALYRNQGGENTGWVTDELVRTLASAIPGLDADQMFEDADSAQVTSMIEDDAVQAEAAEVGGTPSLYIQIGDDEPYALEAGVGVDQVAAALDDALGR
jgi:protein-disulfide isomerase